MIFLNLSGMTKFSRMTIGNFSQINNNNNYSIPVPQPQYCYWIPCNPSNLNENKQNDIIASFASNITVALISLIVTSIVTFYSTCAVIKKTMKPWKKVDKNKKLIDMLKLIAENPKAVAEAAQCVPRTEFEELSNNCLKLKQTIDKNYSEFLNFIEQNIKTVNAYFPTALKNINEIKQASEKLYTKIAFITGMTKEQLANLPEINELNDMIFFGYSTLESFYSNFDKCLKETECQINSKLVLIELPFSLDNTSNTQIVYTEAERFENQSLLLDKSNENTNKSNNTRMNLTQTDAKQIETQSPLLDNTNENTNNTRMNLTQTDAKQIETQSPILDNTNENTNDTQLNLKQTDRERVETQSQLLKNTNEDPNNFQKALCQTEPEKDKIYLSLHDKRTNKITYHTQLGSTTTDPERVETQAPPLLNNSNNFTNIPQTVLSQTEPEQVLTRSLLFHTNESTNNTQLDSSQYETVRSSNKNVNALVLEQKRNIFGMNKMLNEIGIDWTAILVQE